MGKRNLSLKGWMRRSSYGLRRRLWFVFMAIIGVFVGTVIVINVDNYTKIIETRAELRGDHFTDLVKELFVSNEMQLSPRGVDLFLRSYYEQEQIDAVYVADRDGNVLHAGGQSAPGKTLEADQLFQSVLQNGDPARSWAGSTFQIAAPFTARNGDNLIVRVDVYSKAMRAEIRGVVQSNLLAGLVFMVFASILSSLLARGLTEPLGRLTEATQKAADGDLNQTIIVRSNDELEVLADSFNIMLDTIQESISEIHRVAYEDKLTCIPNRAWLNKQLGRLTRELDPTENRFAVMFLDLDRFKQVNDTHGHHVGDLLLKEFADRLHGCMQSLNLKPRHVGKDDGRLLSVSDNEAVIARLGGDEFTLIVPRRAAEPLARTIISELDQPVLLDGRRLATSTSIGIALFPDHGTSREDLLKAADVAMYEAKSAGRRTFAYYNHRNFEKLKANIDLEDDLQRAIHEDQFELYLQPQFSVDEDRVIGAEALIRWQHPSRGILAPGSFLHVAASAGLLPIIGQIMLRKTIRATARLNENRETPLILAVNIAIEELDQEGFADAVARMLKFYGAKPETLEIEITEGTAMEEKERVVQQVAMLRSMGVRLAIDDFGIGYSNLGRLKELAFETLKIDRALVEGIGEDQASDSLFMTVLEMADAIRARVVAEGVETATQRDFLRGTSCQSYQGFLMGKPIPASQFQSSIAANGTIDYRDHGDRGSLVA